MQTTDRLNNYLVLLKIRQKAYHRNVFITGGLFLFAIFATTGTLLLTEWNSRSVFLMALFDILFSLSFVMAMVRLEITKAHIEWVNNFLIRD